MEAVGQGTQRKVTLESLDLVHARRPDVQVFNELLVQYPRRQGGKLGQVVPDNMVVICDQPIKASGSYDLPLQPARPFWMLEYVSKHTERKDYEDNFQKYERELKVPYYLLFHPDDQELILFRHTGRKYVVVKPNEHGRYAIPELDLEVAVHEGWVRFWYRGQLLPLPADLQQSLDETRQQLQETQRKLAAVEQELAELRAQLGRAARRPKA
jgi:Uma2 family endonuclease